jgi:hypothetical protein
MGIRIMIKFFCAKIPLQWQWRFFESLCPLWWKEAGELDPSTSRTHICRLWDLTGKYMFDHPRKKMKKTQEWCLEKPAYGLADGGRLWFLTGVRAMQDHKLRYFPYDKTLFASNDASIIVTTQVDNFIYTLAPPWP